MVVTQLEEITSNRYKVFIDQEFAFVLYKGELHLYKVKEGQKIEEEEYKEIIEVILPKRAKLRALNLLEKHRYTEKQLEDKLKAGFYPPKIIQDALDYVKEFHYIDDMQYAVDYITYNEDKKPEKILMFDLIKKGISADVIKRALEEWRVLGGCQNEQKMIRKFLEKKNYDINCSEKEKRRMYLMLLRKGFSVENVNNAL